MRSLANLKITFALVIAGVLASGQVLAQSYGCGVEREVSVKPLSEQTWKQMNDIYEDIGEENYDLAFQKLKDMLDRDKGGLYKQAIIQQLLGQVEWARERYDSALGYFEQAIKMDALPDNTHYSLMYQVAQLYYAKERYDEALRSLETWFCKAPEEQIKASAYILKASIYASKEDWRNVIPAVDTAIEMEEEPKEAWYQLKLASHFELEQKPEARDTLKVMIRHWPNKKIYWVQLSNVYFQLKNDDQALATMALAHRKNLLDKQTDFLYLSNMYSLREVPYKAAEILEDGIEKGVVESSEKYWTMISDAWYAAEEMERALAGYEKAGELAEDGKIDLRRGYILIDMERWEDAREALKAAIAKGGITERAEGEAHLMVGMAEFNLDNFDEASAAWGRASRYERSKKAAEQWMAHLREERARRAP
ncbi:MAG: tetratricopeptide repeat protein [Xanthomonadales bacterium]|nr:tetratricopeptide repeat protein [Xanthomonadales bacterium]